MHLHQRRSAETAEETQKEVEDSVGKKIDADKENTEKIKQIMKTMNELIKA